MTGPMVDVTVVIPTHLRPEGVRKAVASVLAQTATPREIIVVVDGTHPETDSTLRRLAEPSLHIITRPISGGAGAARNEGVRAATGRFVAFLDDDDTWLPDKLARQCAAHMASSDPEWTVSSTAAFWESDSGTTVWPLRPPRPGERIPDYLFVRRRAGEGVLLTSTLLVPTAIARRVPMPEDLTTHEEWDWLIKLGDLGLKPLVLMTALARYDARPAKSSISTSSKDWRVSLNWARLRRRELGSRAFSAFVLTEVGRAATSQGVSWGVQLFLAVVALRGQARPWDLARHLARPLYFRITGRR